MLGTDDQVDVNALFHEDVQDMGCVGGRTGQAGLVAQEGDLLPLKDGPISLGLHVTKDDALFFATGGQGDEGGDE